MIDQVPPVDLTKQPERPAVVAEKRQSYKNEDFGDIQRFRSEPEAKEYIGKHGGFISTDGLEWMVIYIPRERK